MKLNFGLLIIALIVIVNKSFAQDFDQGHNRKEYHKLTQEYDKTCREIDSLFNIYGKFKDPSEYGKLNNEYADRQSKVRKVLDANYDARGDSPVSDDIIKYFRDLIIDLEVDVESALNSHVKDGDYWDLTKRKGKDYERKAQDNDIQRNTNKVFGDGPGKNTNISFGTGLNFVLSLPVQSIPYYSNNNTTYSNSYTSSNNSTTANSLGFVGLKGDLEFHIIKTSFLDIQLLGTGTYTNTGLFDSAIGDIDQTESYFDYGYGGSVALGSNKIKLFGEYLAGSRYLDFNSTLTTTDYGNGSFTINQSASTNYNFQRFTGGVKIDLNDDDDRESFLKLKYAIEKPDYSSHRNNIWGAGFELRYFINISAMYFPSYPPSGQPSYSLINNGKQSMLFISIGKTFNLFGANN